MIIYSCTSRVRIATLLLSLCAIASTTAKAQYVADNSIAAGSGYFGGTATFPSGPPANYTMYSDGYGSGTGGGVCSGPITVTFKWIGNPADIPDVAILEQTSYTRAYNSKPPPGPWSTGNSDNGLSDGTVTTNGMAGPLYTQEKTSGKNPNGTLIKHYSIVPNPGASFTTTAVYPEASCHVVAAGSATVRYIATLTPVEITFSDSNGFGPNSARDYLTGQKVQARISSPLPTSNEEWDVSGGSPFLDYIATQSQAILTDFPSTPYQTSDLDFYYSAEATQSEVTAQVHLDVPAGSKPTRGLDVSLERDVHVVGPTSSIIVSTGQPEFMDSSGIVTAWSAGTYDSRLWGGVIGAATWGILWNSYVQTPSSFSSVAGYPGHWNYTNTVTPYRKRSLSIGGNEYLDLNFTYVLDTKFPYYPTPTADHPDPSDPRWWDADSSYQISGDAPSEVVAPALATVEVLDSFQLDILYAPPGVDSRLISRKCINWDWAFIAYKGPVSWYYLSRSSNWSNGLDYHTQPEWNGNIANRVWGP